MIFRESEGFCRRLTLRTEREHIQKVGGSGQRVEGTKVGGSTLRREAFCSHRKEAFVTTDTATTYAPPPLQNIWAHPSLCPRLFGLKNLVRPGPFYFSKVGGFVPETQRQS